MHLQVHNISPRHRAPLPANLSVGTVGLLEYSFHLLYAMSLMDAQLGHDPCRFQGASSVFSDTVL